jgi:uncharacterized protein YrzB (UPF0473 family)
VTDENNTLILTDEEGKEHQFALLDFVQVEDQEYAILLPMDEETDEAIILKVGFDENGEEILCEIEDDAEWERVAEAWQVAIMTDEIEEEFEEKETDK